MDNPQMLLPAAVLALWTLAVVVYTGASRVVAVRRGQAKARYFVAYQGEQPVRLAVMERHVANLCETPILFYAVSLWGSALAMGSGFLTLAWAYVAARLVHSLIHLGPNAVVPRLLAFLTSVVLLAVLWILAVGRVLGA